MSKYMNPSMRQIKDHVVREASVEERLRHVDRAERLLSELEPGQRYQSRDLFRQITAKRARPVRQATVSGRAALHDLHLFVEDVSDSADIPAESAGEPVLTVEDVSRRFNVSTKTVDRWRARGLVSRRFKFGNRKRIGFLQSSVERFAEAHADEISRGGRFSQMSDAERQEILAQAISLIHAGQSTAEIIRRLATKFGRSAEAIRYTLKNYDRQHPEAAVFAPSWSRLGDEQKEQIARSFRHGMAADRLAKEYGRSKTEIHRIVSEVRAKHLLEQPIEYIYNKEFDKPNAAEEILGPAPEPKKKSPLFKAPAGLPPYLASLYEVPLLTREQEYHYFRKMNYLKYRAAQFRDGLNSRRPSKRTMDKIEELFEEATKVRNLLIRRNLRLVVSIAKKYSRPAANLFEMISDGNISLMRAIDRFDYGRGFKLSTYATWAIVKNFSRSIPAEHTYLGRFRTGNDELFHDSRDEGTSQFEQEQTHQRQRHALWSILDRLDERERTILAIRYGLEEGTEPKTLEQVGSHFGVTKERIRQLEARALRKLRKIAEQEKLDIPGV